MKEKSVQQKIYLPHTSSQNQDNDFV